MHILLSNDDGYLAPGIQTLYRALKPFYKVSLVAPDRERSAASNSLTLNQPLRIVYQSGDIYAIDGTPTDCVHIGLSGILDEAVDLVISGINRGTNLGDDVHYSGTVAAAMEGRFLGLPAIAVSQQGVQNHHYDCAANMVLSLLEKIERCPVEENTILNVNVPDLPCEQIAGWQITRTGSRHKSEPVVADKDPRGNVCYWVGAPGKEQDAGEGTDFYAIKHGFVSITPIKVDMTAHAQCKQLKQWLEDN